MTEPLESVIERVRNQAICADEGERASVIVYDAFRLLDALAAYRAFAEAVRGLVPEPSVDGWRETQRVLMTDALAALDKAVEE